MGCINSTTAIVAVDRTLCVNWSATSSLSDLALLGNTRTSVQRGLLHHSPLEGQDHFEINVEDTVEMLPKSRKALTIHEIAVLARSSLYGISQVVKDHVTKPTAMAQGRVAHLIEWKGWCKPSESPTVLESDFNSYCHLTEGEQEARFAAGVAEQFAIAEAKLRAWSSVDGEDSNDDSYDEDFPPANETSDDTQGADPTLYPQCLQDCQPWDCQVPFQGEGSGIDPNSSGSSPDTLSSSFCSLEDQPLLRHPGHALVTPASPTDLAAKILGAMQGSEELLACLQRASGECAFRSLGQGMCEDSFCPVSYYESYLSPENEGEEEDYLDNCRDVPPEHDDHRRGSKVVSSGVASLEEEDEEEDGEREQGNQ